MRERERGSLPADYTIAPTVLMVWRGGEGLLVGIVFGGLIM